MFESLEQLQESSSDEEEFFDAKGEFGRRTRHPLHPMITRFILLSYFYLKSSLCLCCSFVHICILLPVLYYCKFISLRYQCLHSITWKTLLQRNTSPGVVWYFFPCWYALFFSKECYMFLISNLLFSNRIAALRSSLGACVL